MGIPEFQFTQEQISLLETITEHVNDSSIQERLQTDCVDCIDRFTEVLEESNIPENDLS